MGINYSFPNLDTDSFDKFSIKDDQDNRICIINEKNHSIDIHKEKIDIKFNGKRNKVYIINPKQLKNLSIHFHASDSVIFIDKNFFSREMTKIIVYKDNQKLYIGKNVHFFSVFIQMESPGRKIYIGDNCLFGSDVNIKNSDSHIMYDCTTNEIINDAQELIWIGQHVWIARSVRILKNASLPNDCIVGMGSYVTKNFYKPNCAITGIPAKIIRENVNWR
ncbi:acyltransferase [Desulfovibrio piger]|uniref:acyltransferase n=1 Tax=Desulfovibrio piger TaxID=901 RepID=UPI0026EDDCBD|nr:hypothetical protein [Desulfovibrio piger]